MAFCPGTPKWESRNSHTWDFCDFWGCITSHAELRLRWGLKQSCSPRQKNFNGMSQVACTRRYRVYSWLLVVVNQTASLTPGLYFDHNLCFKCPNGQCKPILDIYASIFFQCYKKLFEPMGFGPCNRTMKIQESNWDSNSYNGGSLGSVRVHSLTFFALPRACDVTPESFSWPVTLCLNHKPKA
jgi:hypothetical protein